MVFKIIRAPSKLFQLLFYYVDIEAKDILFEMRSEEGEEHFRRMIWKEHEVIDDESQSLKFDIWKGASLVINLKERTFDYTPPVPDPPMPDSESEKEIVETLETLDTETGNEEEP
jgi:hypothetical protein